MRRTFHTGLKYTLTAAIKYWYNETHLQQWLRAQFAGTIEPAASRPRRDRWAVGVAQHAVRDNSQDT